jgi:hypothetical protein
MGLPIEVLNVDFVAGLSRIHAARGSLLVVFVAPPWGKALDPVNGLDLRRTEPPVIGIVDQLRRAFAHCRLVCAIQVYESIQPESLTELQTRFEWQTLRLYGLNAAGQNHGMVLSTIGWKPSNG